MAQSEVIGGNGDLAMIWCPIFRPAAKWSFYTRIRNTACISDSFSKFSPVKNWTSKAILLVIHKWPRDRIIKKMHAQKIITQAKKANVVQRYFQIVYVCICNFDIRKFRSGSWKSLLSLHSSINSDWAPCGHMEMQLQDWTLIVRNVLALSQFCRWLKKKKVCLSLRFYEFVVSGT